MKLSHLLIGIGLCLGLHGMTALADDAEALKASLEKWEKAKVECKGNYSYKVSFASFSGFGNETEIVVKGNKVAERRYREFGGPPQLIAPGAEPPKENKNNFVEKAGEIGNNKKGAPAKTLDELYAEAKVVVAKKLESFEKRYVRFDKAGLLTSCFTMDTRIADDAPTKGVRISGLKLQSGDAAGGGKVYKSPNGKAFPAHWGAPPLRQTRDLRPLPGGYGRGSGTLAKWIQKNLDNDAK